MIFSRRYLKDVFYLVKGLPYGIGKLEAGSIKVHNEWHSELSRVFWSNYVFIANAVLGWFCIRLGSFEPIGC